MKQRKTYYPTDFFLRENSLQGGEEAGRQDIDPVQVDS